MLEIGERDARHHGMSVQAGPRSPLERAEAKVLLELLMGRLAHPTCVDGRSENPQPVRSGWLLR
jgi:hypothetical protein